MNIYSQTWYVEHDVSNVIEISITLILKFLTNIHLSDFTSNVFLGFISLSVGKLYKVLSSVSRTGTYLRTDVVYTNISNKYWLNVKNP